MITIKEFLDKYNSSSEYKQKFKNIIENKLSNKTTINNHFNLDSIEHKLKKIKKNYILNLNIDNQSYKDKNSKKANDFIKSKSKLTREG